MKSRSAPLLVALLAGCLFGSSVQGAQPAVTELKEAPPGLSAAMAAAIAATGYRVTGKSGVVCDVWFVRRLALAPGFKTSERVRYPLQQGELVGVLRYPAGAQPTDFRGQELPPGVYTLRYGLQPDDGNHLGTSEIRDFLVGSAPADDKSPARIDDIKKVFKMSSKASGSTHPAIFLLHPPSEKPVSAPAAKHDSEHDVLILETNVAGSDGGQAKSIPLGVVVWGKSEG